MSLPAGITGLFLKLLTKTKLVTSLFGSDVPYHSSSKFIILLKPIIKLVWRYSNGVTALSKGIVHTATRTYKNAEKDFHLLFLRFFDNWENIISKHPVFFIFPVYYFLFSIFTFCGALRAPMLCILTAKYLEIPHFPRIISF